MRVVALLNFYDEPPARLAATVASLAPLCDGVIAVDGAYVMFPGALRRPSSGPEGLDTIASVARSLGMSVTLHQRSEPWMGNETEKREFMFRLAETETTEDDWLFLIDADEVLVQCPGDIHDQLRGGGPSFLAAECVMFEQEIERTLPGGEVVGWIGRHPLRRFWRALRGIEVGPAHHQFRRGNDWLSDAGRPGLLVSALTLHDVVIEHRNVFRSDERLQRKSRYYADRDYLGIERAE